MIFFNSGMNSKVFWHKGRSLSKFFEHFLIESSWIILTMKSGFKSSPLFSEGFCSFSFGICVIFCCNLINFLRLGKLNLQPLKLFFPHTIIQIFNQSLLFKFGSINLSIWLVNFSNLMVHFGLGKLRLINLIMPVLSITNQINHNILFKLLSIFHT